jgi:hypothetical protein
MMLNIFNAAYFIALFFFIMAQFSKSFDSAKTVLDERNFIDESGFDVRSEFNQTILLVYYAFTTLSSVGFGDFHPKNSFERVVVMFIMGIGVAMFSGFIGTFIDIVVSLAKGSIYDGAE